MDSSAAFDNTNTPQVPAPPTPPAGIQVSGAAPAPQQGTMQAPTAVDESKLDLSSIEPQQSPHITVHNPNAKIDESKLDLSSVGQEQQSTVQNPGDDAKAWLRSKAADIEPKPEEQMPGEVPGVPRMSHMIRGSIASVMRGAAELMDVMDDPQGFTAANKGLSPDALAVLSAAAGGISKVNEVASANAKVYAPSVDEATLDRIKDIQYQVANGHKPGITLPPAGDLSKGDASNLLVKQYENVQPAEEISQPFVKQDTDMLRRINAQITARQKELDAQLSHAGTLEDNTAAGQSLIHSAENDQELKRLEQMADTLRTRLVGKAPAEEGLYAQTKSALMPTTANIGHPIRDVVKEGQQAAQEAEKAAVEKPLSEQLRAVGSEKYNSIGNATMPSTTMDKFISDVKSAHPEDTELAEAKGQLPEQKYIADIGKLQGKPLPLQRAKAIYEELGEKADKNALDNGHLTNEGRVYQDMQAKLWDSIQGTPGTPEWQAAKKDWQQSIKLSQLEKMEAAASTKAQPANSLRTAIGNFTANKARTRGWSQDELDSLNTAGQATTKDEMLRAISSRLIPHITGAIGAGIGSSSGPLGSAAGAVAGELAGVPLSRAARKAALSSATNKLTSAKSAILNNSAGGKGLLSQLNPKD